MKIIGYENGVFEKIKFRDDETHDIYFDFDFNK